MSNPLIGLVETSGYSYVLRLRTGSFTDPGLVVAAAFDGTNSVGPPSVPAAFGAFSSCSPNACG